jgi:hypothetical protein
LKHEAHKEHQGALRAAMTLFRREAPVLRASRAGARSDGMSILVVFVCFVFQFSSSSHLRGFA